ncbi:hydrophobin [Rhodofomes roseus]|uniref:Hydrophobin n=1 Tax=Rhodofomes roseus TaxID=34475 RepID=A0A4Y9Y965_9APHY|nr:hydrophobin [Rhodofomes roseus]KAH9840685.1 hydrophobin [Rhodofomes roseus]TFY58303.1 hypothetical protein EVJ58_g6500 [Rhodofomes roseus]
MQFALTFLTTILAALFVKAAPSPTHIGIGADANAHVGIDVSARDNSSCNAGATYCCNNSVNATNADSSTTNILATIGIDLSNALNNVGLGCKSTIGGAACSSQTLCCTNDTFEGLIALDCVDVGSVSV